MQFNQIMEQAINIASKNRPISDRISDNFYCYPLQIIVPINGANSEKLQSPGHNLWIYNMRAEVYVNGALKNPNKDAVDLITIQIEDKKNNTKFSVSAIPIYQINDLANFNFPGFKLNDNSNIEFTAVHTENAWTSGEIKVFFTLSGFKIY